MTRRWLAVAAALCLAPGAASQGQDDPAPTPATPPPSVHLAGPEVSKLGWGVRAVRAGDLDGDGRLDLAMLNNGRARIELLFAKGAGKARGRDKRIVSRERWEPILEDARFEKVSVVTGIQMFDLAVGDLNGDGRADLAYTGRPDALTIRYQTESGGFPEKKVLDVRQPMQWEGTIRIADLNADKRADLLVMGQDRLYLFTQDQDGGLSDGDQLALTDANSFGLRLLDINADKRADLLYQAPQNRNSLRVRLARPGGSFGPEHPVDLEKPLGRIEPIRLGAGAANAFVYVQEKTGLIDLFTLAWRPAAARGRATLEHLGTEVFSSGTGSASRSYALGDFNGDGRRDIAVAGAEAAAVRVYFQEVDGALAHAASFPSFADIQSLASIGVGDGPDALVLVSPREQLVGISRYVPPGRLAYPAIIPVAGRPLAVAAIPAMGSRPARLLVATTEKRQRRLVIFSPEAGDPAKWVEADRVELADLAGDPDVLRAIDVNGDGHVDLLAFTPGEPPTLLLQNAEGKWKSPSGKDAAARGLGERLRSSQVTTADIDGDKVGELLVAGGGYARSLRLGTDHAFQVIDQYNARESDAAVTAAVAADLDGDDTVEILLLDDKTDSLQLLQRDGQGVYRYRQSAFIGQVDLVEAIPGGLGGRGQDELLLLGKNRFVRVHLRGPSLRARSIGTYETDLQDVKHTVLATANLDGERGEELVAIDAGTSHVLEVLSPDADRPPGHWRSRMHFRIFEADPYYQGRSGGAEPRQVITGDFTADGKTDLALLIHDRLILYPQR